jgi:hypothetical protein
MSSFFGDVKPELQSAFADLFGITHAQLVGSRQGFFELFG